MFYETRYFISPNFTHKKLEPLFYKDVVDVFEDRMVNWLLAPARKLLDFPHGSVPAVALATNYIEGIEIYISGLDSKGQSKEFFRRGFKRIFTPIDITEQMRDAIANALYDTLRCGFAHDGMLRNRVYFSDIHNEPFTVTWPRKNSEFDPLGHLESVVINPSCFIEGIELHFKKYISQLRAKDSSPEQERFRAAVKLKWALDEEPPIIAMTEDEFHRPRRAH